MWCGTHPAAPALAPCRASPTHDEMTEVGATVLPGRGNCGERHCAEGRAALVLTTPPFLCAVASCAGETDRGRPPCRQTGHGWTQGAWEVPPAYRKPHRHVSRSDFATIPRSISAHLVSATPLSQRAVAPSVGLPDVPECAAKCLHLTAEARARSPTSLPPRRAAAIRVSDASLRARRTGQSPTFGAALSLTMGPWPVPHPRRQTGARHYPPEPGFPPNPVPIGRILRWPATLTREPPAADRPECACRHLSLGRSQPLDCRRRSRHASACVRRHFHAGRLV